jgi:HSP20 family protein
MAVGLPIEVSETDDAWRVVAELPGVDERRVEITLRDNVLTIKGEKKAPTERAENGAFMTERAYGPFVRSIRLPHGVEADKVDAAFRNSVLSITLPKPAELRRNVRRIELKAAA